MRQLFQITVTQVLQWWYLCVLINHIHPTCWIHHCSLRQQYIGMICMYAVCRETAD